MQPDWATWRARAPVPAIAPLLPLLDRMPADRWPAHDDWTAVARSRGVCSSTGLPLRFVAPSLPPPPAIEFERRIAATGEVETRPACWHDAFHACAWLNFPHAKARINALHLSEGLDDTPNRRSVLRNVLTLFDEGGLIVVARDAALLDLVSAFRWHALFWRQRDAVQADMDFIIFGHALYERTLAMDYGATGRALLFTAGDDYFGLDSAARLQWLDARVATLFVDPERLAATTSLQPVPINGIPGWHPESEREDYYFDTRQFSPGRRKAAAC